MDDYFAKQDTQRSTVDTLELEEFPDPLKDARTRALMSSSPPYKQ